MNFQAVSVGQKLIENGVKGGYLDAAGTPSEPLLSEIQFVDDAIGQMVTKLKDRGLYESTLVIITSKHGQSPIDPQCLLPDSRKDQQRPLARDADLESTARCHAALRRPQRQRHRRHGRRCLPALADQPHIH